jgi:cyclic beta-1,2-glucan synthetase
LSDDVKATVFDQLDSLSAYARDILTLNPGPSEELIRAEIFGAQRFEEHGRSLAKAQIVHTSNRWSEKLSFFPRVQENIAALRRAYDYIAVLSEGGQYVTPAANWLLENFHLVEAQLAQIYEGVPRRYYADLPKLAEKPLAGLPRVYGIAWAYTAHADSVLDPSLFTAFLHAYQEESQLTLGELWAMPTTLRVVLLENLRRVADHIAQGKAARETAHAVWEAKGALSENSLNTLLDNMRARSLERSYLAQLWQRIPDQSNATDATAMLVIWIRLHCPNGQSLIAENQTAQVATNLTISNIINSLRLIGQIEWRELIDPVSSALQALLRLPSFVLESEGTRQQMTQALQKAARQSGQAELAVAEVVVRIASRSSESSLDQRLASAAYHLIGPGYQALLATLALEQGGDVQRNFRTSKQWNTKPDRRLQNYLLMLLLGTLAFVALTSRQMVYFAEWQWFNWVALFLMLWPASQAVAAVIHRVVAESVRIKPMPRMDFSSGIPPEHRVLVVLPCMLTSTASTRDLSQQLCLHWLASLEQNAQFALLSDWTDADQATMPTDPAPLDEAIRQISALNDAYPSGDASAPRFLVMHRQRSWCRTEGKWIGWERKRGKLEALVRFIAEKDSDVSPREGSDGGFDFAKGMHLATNIRYVVTLDADTGMPPTTLRELVSIAAHPLNTPQIDAVARKVIAGYGILQPRVITPLPKSKDNTWFHAMFAGQCGIDPYGSGTSDLYQDLFGEGSFTGKGLLHVKALHAVLSQRFSDESVLSHDLLEGSIGRCAYISDVMLIEEHPYHPSVDDSRQHRWTRGDWQLLPLLSQARRNGIDSLGLWKMLDNLRRALVIPASLALLILVIFVNPLPLSQAIVLVIVAFLTGPVLGALSELVPSRRGIALSHFFYVGFSDLWRALAATAWQFTQLFHKSGLLIDAILRASWRMCVSRKHLLQWTTAAQAQATARYTLRSFAHGHARSSAMCVALGLLAFLYSPNPIGGAALFALWSLSPVFAWWVSQPNGQPKVQQMDAEHQVYLRGIAQDTWRFFEHCVTPQEHHLPPDNLQFDAESTIAHRTSPTNIGLYLLAVMCARKFGWLSTEQVVLRLQATLGTVDKLPKYEGHLFNWYNTQTLEILQPDYVSTVDSGNLAGHLLATSGACNSLMHDADSTGAQKQQLKDIAAQCTRLCMAMNFSCLYNQKRHLFHIGLRTHDQALDASYYDLLASESRLASFVAIAKGDVPRRHWIALGRIFLTSGVTPGLKSWSGSMFEYVMPALVMREPEQGLLSASGLAAVLEQQIFADAQDLPWGVSESAYFAQDFSLAYQYGPFGVPRLALRRTPTGERVVAPYACIMAAMVMPKTAVANLHRLQQLNARGEYGFMDAVDFTVARQPHGEKYSVVKNHMAHHQAMSLVALCNVLYEEAVQHWFSSVPLVAAYETLLQERCPRQIINSVNPRSAPASEDGTTYSAFQSRTFDPKKPQWQPTHLLSNGRYSVALRANGAGVSRWQQDHARININRWRDDLLRDEYGTFIYLKTNADALSARGEPAAYSITSHPAAHPDWRYSCCFMADRVQFDATSTELDACTTVLVSPEDDTELRTVVITNLLSTAVTYEVLSCFEVVLADAKADEAHPAFSNLFIETVWHEPWRALLLSRRPRLPVDAPTSAAHFLAHANADILSLDCITDRQTFLGRNQSRARPRAGDQAWANVSSPVNAMDPVACLRVKIRVAAGGVARLSFATTVASTSVELAARIDKYLQPMNLERAARMAATLAQVRLRDLGMDAQENAALQDLTTALMYTCPRAHSLTSTSTALVDQRHLWRLGISGDKPIVLVRIHASEGLGLVQSLLRAQPWWSFSALAVDVVVINSEDSSYLSPLQHEIIAQRDHLTQKVQHSFPFAHRAGFYLLREQDISPSEKDALFVLARVVLIADGRPIEAQVSALKRGWFAQTPSARYPKRGSGDEPSLNLAHNNREIAAVQTPKGQFDAVSGEFQFEISERQKPKCPWVNVIANASFGFQVSESGSGYTWATNSRLHQITPWSNDPVQDPCFEHYVLQDLNSSEFLRLTPGINSDATSTKKYIHQVRHGQGYSVFETTHAQLSSCTTFFADHDDAIKLIHVELRNDGDQPRCLRAIALAEWVLGEDQDARRTVNTWKSKNHPAVLALQRQSRAGFGGNTAFLGIAGLTDAVQWTCDRGEFFTVEGQLVFPSELGQRSGNGLAPCGAVASSFNLAAGETLKFTFLLGHAVDAEKAEQLLELWLRKDVPQALEKLKTFWDDLLGRVQVSTPDPLFDRLVNRWLLYQTLGSRLWSKAGFYQAGGAFGFRDQLQDSMAFAVVAPERLRAQILLNASRQFAQGDVQHWWHAPGGDGVRTRFSDDLLWLPFACAHYIEVTGDAAILDAQVAFVEGADVAAGQEDIYYAPSISEDTASVYEHCARTIDRSLAVGQNGLPLMGTGDWNDGMNRVGHEGRGESVWLAWFLCAITQNFAPLAHSRGETARADAWLNARLGWIQALHTNGWDGHWFKRAFFDNGDALGSASNGECQIDLIAQAWSVLSAASSEPFTRSAMDAVKHRLTDADAGLVRLLTPPFRDSTNNPGYIQAYPPGVRENGGQYNHAAAWALMAQAQRGDADAAWETFRSISPAHRNQHPTRGSLYEIEPYVVAGDICSAAPYTGRGGWSWYTGSAAWLYRAALEDLLGLKVRQGRLTVVPCVPEDWQSFEVILTLMDKVITVRWQRDRETDLTPDRMISTGQVLHLAELPAKAVVLVWQATHATNPHDLKAHSSPLDASPQQAT